MSKNMNEYCRKHGVFWSEAKLADCPMCTMDVLFLKIKHKPSAMGLSENQSKHFSNAIECVLQMDRLENSEKVCKVVSELDKLCSEAISLAGSADLRDIEDGGKTLFQIECDYAMMYETIERIKWSRERND